MSDQDRIELLEERLLTITQLFLRALDSMLDIAANVVELETRMALLESRHIQNS